MPDRVGLLSFAATVTQSLVDSDCSVHRIVVLALVVERPCPVEANMLCPDCSAGVVDKRGIGLDYRHSDPLCLLDPKRVTALSLIHI